MRNVEDILSERQKQARAEFDELVHDLRPELHRYCARMVGSVVDGEDVLQDALAKAYYMLSRIGQVSNLRGWLFRIAHNKAIDHLRRYDVRFGEALEDDPPAGEQVPPLDAEEAASFGLSFFLKLTPLQRSSVILKDVLGHSLAEVSEVLDTSVPSIKGALHRGRTRLRSLAAETGEEAPPDLTGPEAELLTRYVDLFNARDYDAIRELLADDVRLDLVSMVQYHGPVEVGGYFDNYDRIEGWRLEVGSVEGRPAILVRDPADGPVSYFVLIGWKGDRVRRIRDYRYARYVLAEAEPGTGLAPDRAPS